MPFAFGVAQSKRFARQVREVKRGGGSAAYRRPDGVYVLPITALKP